LPFAGERSDKVGVVPHHSQMDDPDVLDLVASDPAFMLIDPRKAVAEVCQQIASCARVIASSLHGLIVADAYGVPNRWFAPLEQGWLKYHDYAASIGRTDMAFPLTTDEARAATFTNIEYQDGIDAARDALRDSFPKQLKSSAARA